MNASATSPVGPAPRGARRPVRHVAVVGLMGTGKTTIGARLARALGRPFLDNDALLVEHYGATAAELQAELGLHELHRFEARILDRQLRWPTAAVLNAAASIADDATSRGRLHDTSAVVWLTTDLDVLEARMAEGSHRPILVPAGGGDGSTMRSRLARRQSAFRSMSDIVVDTTHEDPDATTAAILGELARWGPVRSGAEENGYVGPMEPDAEAVPPQTPAPTLEGYQALVTELESLDTEQLRSRALAKGLDGVDKMTREQLVEKLVDEPGANES